MTMGLTADIARKTIEKELKMPSWRGGVDALFSEFPDAPIAAASLGQVGPPCAVCSPTGLIAECALFALKRCKMNAEELECILTYINALTHVSGSATKRYYSTTLLPT